METVTEQPTQQKIKLNPKKIVNFLIVPLAINSTNKLNLL